MKKHLTLCTMRFSMDLVWPCHSLISDSSSEPFLIIDILTGQRGRYLSSLWVIIDSTFCPLSHGNSSFPKMLSVFHRLGRRLMYTMCCCLPGNGSDRLQEPPWSPWNIPINSCMKAVFVVATWCTSTVVCINTHKYMDVNSDVQLIRLSSHCFSKPLKDNRRDHALLSSVIWRDNPAIYVYNQWLWLVFEYIHI